MRPLSGWADAEPTAPPLVCPQPLHHPTPSILLAGINVTDDAAPVGHLSDCPSPAAPPSMRNLNQKIVRPSAPARAHQARRSGSAGTEETSGNAEDGSQRTSAAAAAAGGDISSALVIRSHRPRSLLYVPHRSSSVLFALHPPPAYSHALINHTVDAESKLTLFELRPRRPRPPRPQHAASALTARRAREHITTRLGPRSLLSWHRAAILQQVGRSHAFSERSNEI